MEKIEKVLEELVKLFRKWGIGTNDFFLAGRYAYVLLGYPIRIRKGHLNINVNKNKLSWKIDELVEAMPPKDSKELDDYHEFIKLTGFEFDIVPMNENDTAKLIKETIIHNLPNGNKIRVIKHLANIKYFDHVINHAIKKGNIEKARRLVGEIDGRKKVFIEKNNRDAANFCDILLKKYSYLREEMALINNNEVRGDVAYKGNVKGFARVILDPDDASSLKNNEILVTKMTSPKFTIFISRAKAIVTDEGGTLCHASIIAREHGIPCITGTKFATKIFKTGDQLEIDGDIGIVKKI